MTDRQRNGFILALVAGLIAASAVAIATKKTFLGLDLKGGVQLVHQGTPTPQTPHVTQTALARAVHIMRQRVDQLGVPEPPIQTPRCIQLSLGLHSGLPSGVTASQGKAWVVQQGTVVLQAVPANFSKPPSWSNPNAQYFVVRDHVALFGNDITNPQQSTDQAGAPDVSFGFTSKGANAFQNVTAQIAQRGNLVSGFGQHLNQHFAVALDTQLITVPSIDY